MPKDDLNYKFTENGIVYDFYDVFVPAENFRQPALWVWGAADQGGLGTNDITPQRNTPVTTFAGGTTWKQVVGGRFATFAIKTDGTLWVWGSNGIFEQRLGINVTGSRSTPVTTFAGGNNWKQVSTSIRSGTVGAIKTDGTLWMWGVTEAVGNFSVNGTLTPVTTFAGGNTWKQISVGGSESAHAAAIKTDGSLWVWGRNSDYAQLGVNDVTNRSTPITIFAGGNNWKSVSCGYQYTAAIKTDGSLWLWGRNDFGQLGNFANTTRSTPVTTFIGGNNWKSVSAGRYHTMAIKTDGTLWGWGGSGYAIGINNTDNRSTPVTTFAGGNNWKSVSAGSLITGAIKTDGSLWVWGASQFSPLPHNNAGNIKTPITTFAGGNNWKQISVSGYRHSAAIKYSPDP